MLVEIEARFWIVDPQATVEGTLKTTRTVRSCPAARLKLLQRILVPFWAQEASLPAALNVRPAGMASEMVMLVAVLGPALLPMRV